MDYVGALAEKTAMAIRNLQLFAFLQRANTELKAAWNDAQATAYLNEQRGKHLDPNVGSAFLKLLEVEHGTSLDT